MSQVFSYGITLQEGGRVALFPAAEVLFPAPDGEHLSLFLIIDSGATISALPKSDASFLGIDYKRGSPMTVAGIGDTQLQGWRHEVNVLLGSEVLKLPILFLDSLTAPRVLGREGIFDHFTVVFEETRRKTALITADTDETSRIQEVVDSI